MKYIFPFLLPLLFFATACFSISYAEPESSLACFHNGTLAYAYPVSSLTIDGVANDWPDRLPAYPITHYPENFTSLPEEDLSAYFKVGYNLKERALYCLLVVTDNARQTDSSQQVAWNSHDTHNLYLDLRHSPEASGVLLNTFSQSLIVPAEAKNSWDPVLREQGLPYDTIVHAIRHNGRQTVYEYKINLKQPLRLGQTIGFDHLLVDVDPDQPEQYTLLSWGPGLGKSQNPRKLGDLILWEENLPLQTVKGKLSIVDSDSLPGLLPLRFQSINNPLLWSQALPDSQGNYQLLLPKGKYRISAGQDYLHSGFHFTRLSLKTNKDTITADSASGITFLNTRFSTIAPPELVPEQGILLQDKAQQYSRIDDFIDAYIGYYQIPGVSLAIIKEGKLAYHSTYGIQNTASAKPVGPKTLFEAASITKPVFAFAVLRLAEKGLIDLDKPLHTYLSFPELENDPFYPQLTARHVLTHSSGLRNWARMYTDTLMHLEFQPGTEYGYSGEAFEYLKRVVSTITGIEPNTLLQEEVLQPLALEGIYFKDNPAIRADKANGHFNTIPSTLNIPEEVGAAYSMHTEARNFVPFLLALHHKKGLKPETYQDLFQKHTPTAKQPDDPEGYFGLGIYMEKTPQGLAFGHGGNNGNFICDAMYYPELGLGYVVFTNSNTGYFLIKDIDNFLIKGKEAPAAAAH